MSLEFLTITSEPSSNEISIYRALNQPEELLNYRAKGQSGVYIENF
jgi:hypothetical protein